MEISAVIIAKNEEKMLPGCLKTLKWASEILLVDTGSTDKTASIARKHGARVVKYTKGKDFSDWRNKGLAEARGEWILYVDADERVPSKLRSEIENIVRHPELSRGISAYAIPRRNFMFGREVRHIAVPPDYVKRLFKKKDLKGWEGALHEEPRFRLGMGHLKEALHHYKHETFSEMVEKTNKWSEIEAILMFKAGHPPMNIPRFVSAMGREAWQRFVVHKAFLDGKIGIIYAIYQVFSRFLSYAKLWEMQISQKPRQKASTNHKNWS